MLTLDANALEINIKSVSGVMLSLMLMPLRSTSMEQRELYLVHSYKVHIVIRTENIKQVFSYLGVMIYHALERLHEIWFL